MILQAAGRAWPAGAVHDTVEAVMRTAPFRRSVSTSLLDRFLALLSRGMAWLVEHLGGVPSARTVAMWLVGLVVLLVVARLVVSAMARDGEGRFSTPASRARADEDPWLAAERLAGAGDHEGAAHALYRGVLASLAERERMRRDPSRTSGDYARELRSRGSPSYQPFRAFARRFDEAVYGKGQLDAQLVADLTLLARPLRGTAKAA